VQPQGGIKLETLRSCFRCVTSTYTSFVNNSKNSCTVFLLVFMLQFSPSGIELVKISTTRRRP